MNVKTCYLKNQLSILIPMLFFTFGNFGFFNIFPNKVFFKLFLFLVIFVFSSVLLLTFLTKRENVDFLIDLFFLNILLISILSLNIVMFFSLVVLFYIKTLSQKDRIVINGVIVFLASIFSFLGCVSFFLVNFGNWDINNFYNDFSSSWGDEQIYFKHWYNYFSFVVTGRTTTIFGYEVYRVSSFASEPSLLFMYFYVPAVLLCMTSGFNCKSFIVLLFTLFFSISGVIYMTLFVSVIAYFYFRWIMTSVRFTFILFLISVFLFYYIVIFLGPVNFVEIIVKAFNGGTTDGVKISSAILRLESLELVLSDIKEFRLFPKENEATSVSYVATSYLYGGLITFVTSSVLLLSLSRKVIYLASKLPVFSAFAIGILFQLITFSSYGFFGISGVIILSLMYYTINDKYFECRS